MPPKKSKPKSKAKANPQTQTSSSTTPQPSKSTLSEPVPPAALEALKAYHATKALWDAEIANQWQYIPECRPCDLPKDEIPVPWFDREMEEQQRAFYTGVEEDEESEVTKMLRELKVKEQEEVRVKQADGGKKYPVVDEEKLVKKLLGTEGLVVPSGLVEGGKKKSSLD